MFLHHGIVFAHFQLGGELAGVLRLHVKEASTCRRYETHQNQSSLAFRHSSGFPATATTLGVSSSLC